MKYIIFLKNKSIISEAGIDLQLFTGLAGGD
jgi:hypothetical protein